MRISKWWVLGLLLAVRTAFPLAGDVVATANVKARLLSEVSSIGPGQTVWVALELQIRDGWHTYWRNPGDSGQATKLQWSLPAGFAAGDLVWTTPHRFDLPPLVNYGYAGHVLHLLQITAPQDLKTSGKAVLVAKAAWLVCSDVCIPEEVTLHLNLPTGPRAGTADAGAAPAFAAARADLPQTAPAAVDARVRDGQLVLQLGPAWGAALAQIKSLAFFPYQENGIEYGAPQQLTRGKDTLELAMKLGSEVLPGRVEGVLVATERSGGADLAVPVEISAALNPAAPAAGPPAAGATVSGDKTLPAVVKPASDRPALPVLLLLALVGGLILNLMPCVFPVLSIKALSLVEQARKHPAAVRGKGLAFAAGVIGSMLCLAAVLLALRAGGEQIGWGFQLQSPLFVTLMVYLLLAVGLNLSGVFEVGGGLAGLGDSLTRGEGYRASFFTGVLTTLVATPCTAPFMAAAVGAALTQTPAVALSIFAALGAGLALPYVLLSFAPWMRRALPRPGAWMDTLKQVFAFPIYASAAWLLWVLAQQTSSLGLGAALAGVVLIALSAWAYQKTQSSTRGARSAAWTTVVVGVGLAVFLPVELAGVDATAAAGPAAAVGNVPAGRGAPRSDPAAAAAREPDVWVPYDAGRVAELDAAGRPVLLNFTASWCLTCLVNERNAFADAAVVDIFHRKGVTLMKGDWTSRDPSITRALASFGRAGVPLYVAYNASSGSRQPLILPQLLSARVVHDAFAALPDRDLK